MQKVRDFREGVRRRNGDVSFVIGKIRPVHAEPLRHAFPALANVLDHAFGTPGLLFYAVTFGLNYHTYISLTANAARAGWSKYIPQSVLKFVTSEIKAKADRAAGKKGGA